MRYSVIVTVLAALFFHISLFAKSPNAIIIRSKIGTPCATHEDCGADLHCIVASETKGGAHFSDGYCVKFDCSLSDPCDPGATCVEIAGRNFNLCLASCSDDSHCRNGYACHEGGVCLPSN